MLGSENLLASDHAPYLDSTGFPAGLRLRCRITWPSYTGKENTEDSCTDIISTGYLGLLNKTTLLEAGITLPAAGRLQCRYIVHLAQDHGKIHCHRVCSLEQCSPTQTWTDSHPLRQSSFFFPPSSSPFPAPRHATLVTVFYPDEYTQGRFLTVSVKLESTNTKD